MEDKKKPVNGSFTQVPNVFFDTCDLSESAQILYLRLYRHIAYKDDHKFVGSIRKLSTLVRLSKSTVDRMLKRLEEARLIHIAYELSQDLDSKVMTITINPQELWILNKQHYEESTVPIWDKVMPDAKVLSQIGTICPETGQHIVNLGQSDVNLGQTVPDVSSNSEQVSRSTEKKEEEREEETSIHSIDQSSLSDQELPSGKEAIGIGYLEMWLKDFLRGIGEYSNRREHAKRLGEIYLACDIDDAKAFRAKVDAALYSAKLAHDPIESFFRQLS